MHGAGGAYHTAIETRIHGTSTLCVAAVVGWGDVVIEERRDTLAPQGSGATKRGEVVLG